MGCPTRLNTAQQPSQESLRKMTTGFSSAKGLENQEKTLISVLAFLVMSQLHTKPSLILLSKKHGIKKQQ